MCGIGLLLAPRVLGASGGALGGPPGQQYGWGAGLTVGLCLAGVAGVVLALVRIYDRRHPARRLSPEQVTSYRGKGEDRATPEVLHRLINERLARIRRTLRSSPPKIEVEMCALGYDFCEDDTVALLRLIDDEIPKTNPLRRSRLGKIRRKAIINLSEVRKALPAYTLRCSRGDSLDGELP